MYDSRSGGPIDEQRVTTRARFFVSMLVHSRYVRKRITEEATSYVCGSLSTRAPFVEGGRTLDVNRALDDPTFDVSAISRSYRSNRYTFLDTTIRSVILLSACTFERLENSTLRRPRPRGDTRSIPVNAKLITRS